MKARWAAAAATGAILAVASNAQALIEYHSFVVAKEQVLAAVRTIALVRPTLPVTVPNRDALVRTFEDEAASILREAGYEVVPAGVTDRLWREHALKLGGVYDPVTGESDDEKFETCYDFTARELARLHGVDAVAFLSLTKGQVRGGFAQLVNGGAQGYANGEPIFIGGAELRAETGAQIQYIEGNYFGLRLFDLGGSPMYAADVPIEWTRLYWNRSYEDRGEPPFAFPGRNTAAVRDAVRPLQKPSAKDGSATPK